MGLGSQLFYGIEAPMPIQVQPSQITSRIAINDSIYVDHWDEKDIKLA